jgi:hypothetical protein
MIKKMMLSKDDESTNAVAIIKEGANNNKFISISEDDNNNKFIVNDLFDHISEKDLRKQKKFMSLRDIMKIKRSFENNDIDDEIKDIYQNIRPQIEKSFKSHIKIDDGYIQPIPLIKKNQTDRLYISGMSGSGKSTFIKNYALQYKKLYPNNEIYMISKLNSDPSIDDYINIKRLLIDENIIDIEFNAEEFENSLFICDDIDTINNKKIYEKVKNIRDTILETGRHFNISVCNVSHQILNYKNSRTMILESTKIIFFLTGGGAYQIKNYLKNYKGLSNEQIKLIMNIKSRWIQLSNTYPTYILGEHDAYIL